ncbi:MAG TPA: hypothetical protein VHZ75_00035 [Solirubrobacteraceae bacterium]|nr:hypothetical protein [Solirubrobacteraceae bacterium]
MRWIAERSEATQREIVARRPPQHLLPTASGGRWVARINARERVRVARREIVRQPERHGREALARECAVTHLRGAQTLIEQ